MGEAEARAGPYAESSATISFRATHVFGCTCFWEGLAEIDGD